jgi:hypothetical protein
MPVGVSVIGITNGVTSLKRRWILEKLRKYLSKILDAILDAEDEKPVWFKPR